MNYYQETYGEQMQMKNGKIIQGEKKWMVNKNGKVEGWVYKYPSPSIMPDVVPRLVPPGRRPRLTTTRKNKVKSKPGIMKKRNKTQVKRGKNK